MFASLRRRVPRLGRVPRLCAVGICLLLALDGALADRDAAATPRTVAVVVAARDLPPGHILGRRDLGVSRWPAALRPASARADLAPLVGRRLTTPVAAGEAITGNRLLGRELAAGLPAGMVAVPVVLDDPHVADLVHPGDRVDLLAAHRPPELSTTTPAPAAATVATVARSALVLAAFHGGEDGSGAELVLAVERAVAVAITRDRPTHVFTAVGLPP